jgi:DNA-binding response OmpR family regulator
LAVTAFHDRFTRARAFTAGFDEYLEKPLDAAELCRIVAKLAHRAG